MPIQHTWSKCWSYHAWSESKNMPCSLSIWCTVLPLSVEYTFTWMLLSVNLYDIQWYTHWHTSKYRIILRDDFAWTSQTPFPIASPSDPKKNSPGPSENWKSLHRGEISDLKNLPKEIYIYIYLFIIIFFKCMFFWGFFGVKFCDLDFVFAAAFTHQVKKIAGCAMVFRCAIVVFLCLCLSTKCHAYREFRRAAAHEEVKTFTPAATKRLMTAVGRSLSKIESRLQQQLFKNSQRSLHLGQSTFKNPLVRNLQRMQNAQNLGKYRFSSFPGAGKKTLMPQNLMPMISRRLMTTTQALRFGKVFTDQVAKQDMKSSRPWGKKRGGNLRCCTVQKRYVPSFRAYTYLNRYESIFLDLLFYLMPKAQAPSKIGGFSVVERWGSCYQMKSELLKLTSKSPLKGGLLPKEN